MYNIAVAGATGAVGRKMLEVLEEYNLPIDNLYMLASSRSAGKEVKFGRKTYIIEELTAEIFVEKDIDIVLFSAGGEASLKFAPIAAANNIIVIDNSSAFRMDEDKALVVPEININAVDFAKSRIIANPNCSTIQSVLPLAAIDKAFNLTRVDYVTFQAVSGAGQKGIADLENGENGVEPTNFPYPIYNNVLPHIDAFLENGYTKEEIKMVNETRKILARPDLEISATCVRVPVQNSHSISISFIVEKPTTVSELKQLLTGTKGIVVHDDIDNLVYPMPLNANDTDEVYVGRIRQDLTNENQFHMFVVADNIRKGAASNAVQIAKYLIKHNVIK